MASGSSAPSRGRRPKVEPLPIAPLRTLRRTGQMAHVIFLDASSCTRALPLAPAQPGAKPGLWRTNVDEELPRGLAHYIKHTSPLALHSMQYVLTQTRL